MPVFITQGLRAKPALRVITMNCCKWVTVPGLALIASIVGIIHAQGPNLVVPPDKALLIIRTPTAETAVTIGTFASGQRGYERLFFTPALTPGQSYSYQIEAVWQDGGVQKKSVREVTFEAGKATIVDFRVADAVEPLKKLPAIVEKPKTEEKKPVVVVKKQEEKKPAIKHRSFQFTYAGTVKELPPGKKVSVWLPVAVSGPEQDVKIISQKLPGEGKIYQEKQYGNTMLHFQGKSSSKGELSFEVIYQVKRKEVRTDVAANVVLKPAGNENLARFLQPDAKVPIVGKPLELLKDKKLPGDQFGAAKVLYDVVNGHMKYSKVGTGWGQGDSVWACDSKFGNCSDFHSLFISMARGNKIPSKFEMGFSLPTMRGNGPIGGYHCWAWFYPDKKGWVPVDISEANRNPELKDYYFGNLTEDRVRFSTGRDINLEPRQKGPSLNFFIYPYVEVDGKTYPQEKIDRRFAYQDVK